MQLYHCKNCGFTFSQIGKAETCPDCGKPTRVAHATVDGKKARVCKHCGASLDKAAKAAVKKEKKTARKSKKESAETEAPAVEEAPKKKPARKTAKKTETADKTE